MGGMPGEVTIPTEASTWFDSERAEAATPWQTLGRQLGKGIARRILEVG